MENMHTDVRVLIYNYILKGGASLSGISQKKGICCSFP